MACEEYSGKARRAYNDSEEHKHMAQQAMVQHKRNSNLTEQTKVDQAEAMHKENNDSGERN